MWAILQICIISSPQEEADTAYSACHWCSKTRSIPRIVHPLLRYWRLSVTSPLLWRSVHKTVFITVRLDTRRDINIKTGSWSRESERLTRFLCVHWLLSNWKIHFVQKTIMLENIPLFSIICLLLHVLAKMMSTFLMMMIMMFSRA